MIGLWPKMCFVRSEDVCVNNEEKVPAGVL